MALRSSKFSRMVLDRMTFQQNAILQNAILQNKVPKLNSDYREAYKLDTDQLSVILPNVAVLNVVAPFHYSADCRSAECCCAECRGTNWKSSEQFSSFFIYNLQVPEASFSSNSFFAGGSIQFWEMAGTPPLALILHFLVKISSFWDL